MTGRRSMLRRRFSAAEGWGCLLLRRFDSEAGEAGELEARETGDEHARDHGKEKDERRNACKNSCRFLADFVVFLARYFCRVFKP